MPYITVEAHVDLDDFDTDDLIEELKSRGHGSAELNPMIDLTRIEHLIVCGQVEQAKAEAWSMIVAAIGETV